MEGFRPSWTFAIGRGTPQSLSRCAGPLAPGLGLALASNSTEVRLLYSFGCLLQEETPAENASSCGFARAQAPMTGAGAALTCPPATDPKLELVFGNCGRSGGGAAMKKPRFTEEQIAHALC